MDQEILNLLKEIQRVVSTSGGYWMPLISTLIGAIIALIGSIGVQILQSHLARRKETRYFLREKIETIGILLIEFENALQSDMASIYGVGSPSETEAAMLSQKLQELSLNINLYYHGLAREMENLEKVCLSYFNNKREVMNKQRKEQAVKKDDIDKINFDFQQCLSTRKALFEMVINESNRFKDMKC